LREVMVHHIPFESPDGRPQSVLAADYSDLRKMINRALSWSGKLR
jgi:hypothetical protein